MAEAQSMLNSIWRSISSLTASEWASWVQAIGSIAAVLAALKVVSMAHGLAEDRRTEDRKTARRVSLEHWARSLERCREICVEMMARAEGMAEGAPYFLSARANLQTVLDLMKSRSLDALESYDELKFLSSGMAAVQGLIGHTDQLLLEHSHYPQWHTKFQAAAHQIPEQLQLCADALKAAKT
jgi:hypothetical protein